MGLQTKKCQYSKGINNKMKRQLTEREKIFANIYLIRVDIQNIYLNSKNNKQKNNPILKGAKDQKRHFPKGDTNEQVSMKKCSPSLIPRGMHIKATARPPLTPAGVTFSQKDN